MAENDIWTVKAALDWTVGYLERKGDENPRLSAEWLLSEATGLRRIDLYVQFERPLSMPERGVLREYVRRRGTGEPLQYITGEVAFRHIAVKVARGVLIPRPETEVLVSELLALLPSAPRPRACDEELGSVAGLADDAESADLRGEEASLVISSEAGGIAGRPAVPDAGEPLPSEASGAEGSLVVSSDLGELLVADICTGTGCIACSIAQEHPLVRVIATDIEPRAVKLACENAEALGLGERVQVLEGDLGTCIDGGLLGGFDAVVSNPPYVPTAVMADIPREVADFEPELALDGGEDGLDVFRRLLTWSFDALKPGGALAVELHETCLDQAADLAKGAGFEQTRIVNDLTGRPRVLTARKPLA